MTMRTRKEIEDGILMSDVNREILLDIRQMLAILVMKVPSSEVNKKNIEQIAREKNEDSP